MATKIKNPELMQLPGLVYMAETRGGKRALTVTKREASKEAGGGFVWTLTEWTDGQQRGISTRNTAADMAAHVEELRTASAEIDGINYVCHWNLLNR